MAFESGKRTTLAKPVSTTDTTIYLASAPTVTSGRLYIKNNAQEERIAFSGVSGNSVTGCSRNISKTADPLSSGVGLSRIAGETVKLVAMHDQIPDKTGTNTRAGAQTFSQAATFSSTITAKGITFTGTDNYGLRLKSLTTAQRDALTPNAGDKIFNSTTGTEQTYYGGTWNDNASGTTANASPTVAGKVEISTQTETEDQTTTGGTGATVVPTNATINPNNVTSATPATGDKFTFSDISNSNKLRSATLQTIVDTGRPLATNAEASTGSGTTQSITPAQLKKYFGPEPSAGTTYTAASASGTLGSTSGTTYLQARIGTIARTGTYTVEFSVSSGAGVTGYGRIYKNGVAFGTERTVVGTTTAFTENLAFSEGDTISLWYKSGGGGSASVADLSVKYDLVDQKAFTLA